MPIEEDGVMAGVAAAFVSKHAPVVFGLALGSAAKFGRMMTMGQPITKGQVVGHILMMGVVGLAATVTVDLANINDSDTRAFTAAILAVAASDVIKYLQTRAWRRFFGDTDERLGNIRQVVQAEKSATAIIEQEKQKREGEAG